MVALIAVCGVNVLATVRRVPPPSRMPAPTSVNAVMRQEKRMAKLRQALHRHGARGTIGYLTDVPAAELAAQPHGMEEYFLTQFALVPWVLDARKLEGEWLVANLRASPLAERMPAGFRNVEDLGSGVWLLQRMERASP